MPIRDTAPLGAPCWIDLGTSDPEGARAFYGQLFGWTAEAAGEEYGGYINFSKNGSAVAGCMRNSGDMGFPDAWSVYLASADVQATADAVPAAGGQVVVAPMEVPAQGTMAFFADPGGAMVGAWQPGGHNGFQIFNEPGTPVWFEVLTRDHNATVRFYESVFGWQTDVLSDTPEFRYTTLGKGDDALAGIMDATDYLPAEVPPHWSLIFLVEDTDAGVAKVQELGGTVLREPEDTPYGRVAQVTDTTGAVFSLMSEVPQG